MIKYFIDRKINKSITGDIKKDEKNIYINDKKIKAEDYIIIECDKCGKEEKAVFKRRDKYFKDKVICTKCHRTETNLEKYGTEWPTQSKQVRNKTENTCLKKYGTKVPNAFGSLEYKKSIRNKYGTENINSIEEIRDKIKQTSEERYGGSGRASSIIRSKIDNTKLERYGDKNYTNRKKNNKTIKNRYNVNNISELKEVRSKARDTMISRYGVDNINGCQWFKLNEHKIHGKFELKTAKFLIENNINFITHEKIQPIPYSNKDNKECKYYPDFYLPDYDLYLEPHAKYYWNDEFEWKIQEVEKQINILYFDEDYNIEEVLLSLSSQQFRKQLN